jgi:ferredoxin-NADP reductase
LLRALRIPALSPGWQDSFRALLNEAPGSGNAGLAVTSPPPAWSGFRQLTVTAITHESDSAISLRLEDPAGAPLPPARPGQYLTVRVQPDKAQRALLRNYSLSGPPGAGYYRITVKREPGGAVSGYLHTSVAVGDQLDIAAPRGTFILDQTQAPVLLISAGIGATPVLAMLAALEQEHSAREVWCLYGARNGGEHPFAAEARALVASLPNARAHVYYSRPDPADVKGRDFDSAGRLTASLLAELNPPSAADVYMCGPTAFMDDISAGLAALGFDASRVHTEVFGPAASVTPGIAATPARAPHPPAGPPETGRRLRSLAATSRSHGAANTPACSNSPRPAMYPSAGHAAPASAIPARQRSSGGMSITVPTRSNLPLREVSSSAAQCPAMTLCSICDRTARRVRRGPSAPSGGGKSAVHPM